MSAKPIVTDALRMLSKDVLRFCEERGVTRDHPYWEDRPKTNDEFTVTWADSVIDAQYAGLVRLDFTLSAEEGIMCRHFVYFDIWGILLHEPRRIVVDAAGNARQILLPRELPTPEDCNLIAEALQFKHWKPLASAA